MKFEKITLKNFKVFQSATFRDISPLSVIIGVNGSGKSTLFDAFKFLKDAMQDNIHTALKERGGFINVVSRGHDTEAIEFIIQYTMPVANVERLVVYWVQITRKKGKPVVLREVLGFKHDGLGFRYLFDFRYGKGYVVLNEAGTGRPSVEVRQDVFVNPAYLALGTLELPMQPETINSFRQQINSWCITDSKEFTTPKKLSQRLQSMYREQKDAFELSLMKTTTLLSTPITATTDEKGQVFLEWGGGTGKKDPFTPVPKWVTKHFIYSVLQYTTSHTLLSIDDIESSLSYFLLLDLAEEFRLYAFRHGQVIISTHSPYFLNAIDLEEVFFLIKEKGFTTVKPAKEDTRVSLLMEEGNQMGYLWMEGLLNIH